jgi:hypothetical protein
MLEPTRALLVGLALSGAGCIGQVGFGERCTTDADCAAPYHCDADDRVCARIKDGAAHDDDDDVDAGAVEDTAEQAAPDATDAGSGDVVDDLLGAVPDAGL